jgi:integrase
MLSEKAAFFLCPGKELVYINRPKSITNFWAGEIEWKLPTRKERLIFRLLVETGARISDILDTRVYQVHREPFEFYERKTGKKRLVALSEHLSEDLKKFSPYRFSYGHTPDVEYVFKSIRNSRKPYNRMTFHRRLKKVAKRLNIDFSAHSMRKLYAQNIFAKSGNIFVVQEALSHKYVTTTAAYLDIDLVGLITTAAASKPPEAVMSEAEKPIKRRKT